MSKSGIHINPKNKGKFNATKKATGKTTAELTHSSNPTTRKRAIFAQNASHWKHKAEGGYIPSWDDTEEMYYPTDQAFGGYYPGNYYNDYGFGSWLGRNVGNIAQTIGGAALIATGVGAPIGAGMMASGAGGFGKDAAQQDLENKEAGLNQNKANVNTAMGRLNSYNQNMASGGHLPEGNSTLKEAKNFIKLYPEEMKAGEKVEYEHTGNTKLAQRIAADHIKDSIKLNKGNPPDYYKKLQQVGASDELNKMPQLQMTKGGKLSKNKAKEMLRDGTAHGKQLTDKQKKYFGFIAGGGNPKKWGGDLYQNENVHNLDKYSYKHDDGPSGYLKGYKNGGMVKVDPRYIPMYYANGGPGDVPVSIPGYHPMTDINAADLFNRAAWTKTAGAQQMIDSVQTRGWKGYLNGNTANQYGNKYFAPNDPMTNPMGNTPPPIVPAPDSGGWSGSSYPVDGHGNIIGPGKFEGKGEYQKRYGGNYADGGPFMNSLKVDKNMLTSYTGGGSHQENKYGGIPVGKGARVEEGEERVDFEDGSSYIFSNRLPFIEDKKK
jgi:hypothetical protein